jgi:5'-deoxynucleotidase YfbR-like HD superfamily hydrolase
MDHLMSQIAEMNDNYKRMMTLIEAAKAAPPAVQEVVQPSHPFIEVPPDDIDQLVATPIEFGGTHPFDRVGDEDGGRLTDIAWSLSRQPRFAGHTITRLPYNVAHHSVFVSEIVQSLCTWVDETGHVERGEYLADRAKSPVRVTPPPFFDAYQDSSWNSISQLAMAWNLFRDELASYLSARQAPHYDMRLTDPLAAISLFALFHDAHEYVLVDVPSPIKAIDAIRAVYKELEKKMDAVIFDAIFEISDDEEDLLLEDEGTTDELDDVACDDEEDERDDEECEETEEYDDDEELDEEGIDEVELEDDELVAMLDEEKELKELLVDDEEEDDELVAELVEEEEEDGGKLDEEDELDGVLDDEETEEDDSGTVT